MLLPLCPHHNLRCDIGHRIGRTDSESNPSIGIIYAKSLCKTGVRPGVSNRGPISSLGGHGTLTTALQAQDSLMVINHLRPADGCRVDTINEIPTENLIEEQGATDVESV